VGPQRELRIIRRTGERTCSRCIQERHPPLSEDKYTKRYHCFAIVGWNYKGPLIFYEISGNTNGKMTQVKYIELLEQYWLPLTRDPGKLESYPGAEDDRVPGEYCVLEEDGDSGHIGKKATKWKKEHNVKFYINCPSSPDFSIVENCWQPMKQHVHSKPHWEDDATKALAYEGWEKVTQKMINDWVKTMPQRLIDCQERHGKMTGW